MFKSYKLDDMQASKRKLDELRGSDGEHVYFAKFLTSEKVGNFVFYQHTFLLEVIFKSIRCLWGHGSVTRGGKGWACLCF